MRKIVTVLGELPPEELGFCQFHEHLLIQDGRSRQVNEALFMDDWKTSAREAERYAAAGGCALIDAQPGGCGRMADGLAKIAKKSGVHILCVTGFHKLIFYPEQHWIFAIDQNTAAEFFVRELTRGVDNHCEEKISGETAPEKAGLLKCALDVEGLTPRYRLLFEAAVRAAGEADRIMMVHIEPGSDPLVLLDFLLQAGMTTERLVFCHLDRDVSDLTLHRKLLDAGVYLEFDTIGRFRYHGDEEELRAFQTLINDGFEDRLLFSLDTTRARLLAYGPTEVGLDYIHRVFLSKMREAGITKEQIQKIAVENPRRALVGG